VSGLFIDSIDSLDQVSGLVIDSIDSLDEVSGLVIDSIDSLDEVSGLVIDSIDSLDELSGPLSAVIDEIHTSIDVPSSHSLHLARARTQPPEYPSIAAKSMGVDRTSSTCPTDAYGTTVISISMNLKTTQQRVCTGDTTYSPTPRSGLFYSFKVRAYSVYGWSSWSKFSKSYKLAVQTPPGCLHGQSHYFVYSNWTDCSYVDAQCNTQWDRSCCKSKAFQTRKKKRIACHGTGDGGTAMRPHAIRLSDKRECDMPGKSFEI
jgi:hypothetical protein